MNQDPNGVRLGAAICPVPAGKTANVSVSVTATGGGGYTQRSDVPRPGDEDQYSPKVKSVKLSLEDVSAGCPVSLSGNVITFTPRNRYDSASVQLLVEITDVRARDQAEGGEHPIRIFLLLLSGQ